MPGYALSTEAVASVAVPLWRALRGAAAPSTVNELHRASKAAPNAIQLRLKRWERVGFVDVLPAEPARYAIAPKAEARVKAPTYGSLSDDAWAALRRLGKPATFEEILSASGASDRPLYCRLRRWTRAGHVVKHEAKPSRFALSAEAPDVAEPPRVSIGLQVRDRKSTARERIWSVMRVLKTFDVPTLMITAEVKRRNVEDFLNLLARAGYVRINGHPVARRGGGNLDVAREWSTYTLIRSTGRKCPTITNPPGGERRLLDRNNGQSVPVGPGLRRRTREAPHGR